jgi:NACalpha-BTF3-like transcription factor
MLAAKVPRAQAVAALKKSSGHVRRAIALATKSAPVTDEQ